MFKKHFPSVSLTCLFQETQTSGIQSQPVDGLLRYSTDGGLLFQETLPRRRDIRNHRIYEGAYCNFVLRKDGRYYAHLRAFTEQELQDEQLPFKVYCDIAKGIESIRK